MIFMFSYRLLIASILFLITVAAALAIPEENLIQNPLGEDAFYMFSIARNIGRGDGFTYNYDIQTNGVQPLIVVPYSIIFFITESFALGPYIPLRFILILNFSIFILTAFAIYHLTYISLSGMGANLQNLASNIAFVLFLMHGALRSLYIYGLETGLYLFMIVLFLVVLTYYQELHKIDVRQMLLVGVISGLTILARIDFLFFLISISIIFIAKNPKNLKTIFFINIIASVIASPWFLYNYFAFGDLLPSSSAAQTGFIKTFDELTYRTWATIYSIVGNINIYFLLPVRLKVDLPGERTWLENSPQLFIALCFLIMVYLSTRFYSLHKMPTFIGFFIGFIILIIAYIYRIKAVHFYGRYFAPFAIMWIVIFSTALAHWSMFFIPKRISRSKVFICITLFLLISFVTNTWQITEERNLSSLIDRDFTHAAVWAMENIDPNAKVGAFQSGTIGYFNENTYNLDGKVNPDVLDFVLTNNSACYIINEQIDIIIDWQSILNDELGETFLVGNSSDKITIANGGWSIYWMDYTEDSCPN